MKVKDKYRDAISILILLGALIVFFMDALLGKRTLIFDAVNYFYPYFFTVSNSLRHGELPLWNPYLFNGFPTIANIEAQIFYPLNLLFLPFTPFTPYAVNLSLILHCFLAGVFMYFLCRNYLMNHWACLLSAMVYMLSGYTIGHFQHVTIVEVLAWLPLIFLFLEKALEGQSLKHAVFGGFFFGISILAGHPQTSHGIIFALSAHTIYRAISGYFSDRKWKSLFFPASALVVMMGVGVIVAAVQLIPTYEFIKQATRGEALSYTFSANSGQSFSPGSHSSHRAELFRER